MTAERKCISFMSIANKLNGTETFFGTESPHLHAEEGCGERSPSRWPALNNLASRGVKLKHMWRCRGSNWGLSLRCALGRVIVPLCREFRCGKHVFNDTSHISISCTVLSFNYTFHSICIFILRKLRSQNTYGQG